MLYIWFATQTEIDIVQSQITDYVKYINYMLRHDQK